MVNTSKIKRADLMTITGSPILTVNENQFSIPGGNTISNRIIIIKGRDLPEIDTNAPLYVVVYVRSGERIRYPAKVSLSTPLQLNIIMHMDEGFVLEERRHFYKVNTEDMQCDIAGMIHDSEMKQFEIAYTAKVSNFSIGGLFLETNQIELSPSDAISLVLHLDGVRTNVMAKVLRVQLNTAGELVGYGCCFTDVTARNEELFAQFVYKRQQLELQREKQRQLMRL